MRKLIVELRLNEMTRAAQGDLFEKIEAFELLEMLKLDLRKGVKIGLMDIKHKTGFALEDVAFPAGIELLDVMHSEGNTSTCVVKLQLPEEFRMITSRYDLNLVWDTPAIVTEDARVYSAIGPEEDLKKFLELLRFIGTIEKLSFLKPTYQPQDLIASLTKKQREIMIEAKKHGYYSYPRRISAKALATKLGLAKATILEHLRKAEIRLVSTILAGY